MHTSTINILAFPGGSVSKESACNAEDQGPTPELGRFGEGNGNLLHYSCLENPMDRSLAGYSQWGHKSQIQGVNHHHRKYLTSILQIGKLNPTAIK